MTVVGGHLNRNMFAMSKPTPEVELDMRDCGGLTAEQCDRRAVIFKWAFRDKETSTLLKVSRSRMKNNF